jgi:hypothetical protein
MKFANTPFCRSLRYGCLPAQIAGGVSDHAITPFVLFSLSVLRICTSLNMQGAWGRGDWAGRLHAGSHASMLGRSDQCINNCDHISAYHDTVVINSDDIVFGRSMSLG